MATTQLQPQKEILVDNEKYIVQLYAPTFGLTLYAKLIRLLGEPAIKLVGMFKGQGDLKAILEKLNFSDLDLDSAGEALSSLFQNLPADQFVPLIQEILSNTFHTPGLQCVNETFESRFTGRYNHIFKLVAKTLGAQYPDFLSGIVKRSGAGKVASVSSPKVTSA